MTVSALNTIGLILNAAGVIGLFFFGMPFQVRTGGANFIITEQSDEAAIAKEKMYDKLGWLALALILIGTGFQIRANLV